MPKHFRLSAIYALPLALLLALGLSAHAQGTAFTYQGRLTANGLAANGSYDLVFTLYTNSVTLVPSAEPVTNTATAVTNGLFTTLVDFGPGAFVGGSNWLELAVSTNGANAFTTLSPRQQVTPTPYALTAGSAATVSGTVNASQLSGSIPAISLSGTLPLASLPPGVVTNSQQGVIALGITNVNTYNNQDFDFCNSTAFPFLNTHWVYTNGGNFTHGGTNFFYYDVSSYYGTWIFSRALVVTNFPDNNVFLAQESGNNLIDWNVADDWVLGDFVTPDTGYITNNVFISTSQTAMLINASANNVLSPTTASVRHFAAFGGGFPMEQWFDSASNLLAQVEAEGAPGYSDDGKITTYGYSFGIPWTNGLPGQTTFRLNGALINITGGADNRGQVHVGFSFGNQLEYGANMEWLVRRDSFFNAGNSGIFSRSIVQDSHGGVQLGNTPYSQHGYKDDAPAWTEIWGSNPASTNDRPQLLLTATKLAVTVTNGAIQSDGTNIWITQGGVTAKVLTESGGNGAGLTGIPSTAITGGLNVIVTNTPMVTSRLYFTNGILVKVTTP